MTVKDFILSTMEHNLTGGALICAGTALFLHGTQTNQAGVVRLGDGLVSAGLLALRVPQAQSATPPDNTTTKITTEQVTTPPPQLPPTPPV